MKKLAAGLTTAVLTTTGLAAFSAAVPADASVPVASFAAVAKATCTPYTGTVATRTSISGPRKVKTGNRATFVVTVLPASGTAKPKGTVRVRVRRNGQIFREVTRGYGGSPINIVFPGPAVLGNYNVFARFTPKNCSVFKQAPLASASFTVVK